MREFGSDDPGSTGAGRLGNGLHAHAYVALTDVDPALGELLLNALGRARIAAYLDVSANLPSHRRLFVATEERSDARTIVSAAVRAMGEDPALPEQHDPFDDIDTDTAFRELIADWHVDTVAAVRDAERDLTREDAEWRARLGNPQASDEVWLDEDHYVPPPPPPLPRLARPTIIAIAVMLLSIMVLAMGVDLGLPGNFILLLGCGGLVAAAAILFTRLRDQRRDDDDDGSAV